MSEHEHITQTISRLHDRIKELETVCLKLEAERDAHLHVIEQLFKSLIPHE
jgi:hypothetical protein